MKLVPLQTRRIELVMSAAAVTSVMAAYVAAVVGHMASTAMFRGHAGRVTVCEVNISSKIPAAQLLP
jgi:hypothetical protein